MYGANSVCCVFSKNTFADRYLNLAPVNGCFASGQEFWLFCPSPSGRQPPVCIRSSSCQPSSNSWLPTEAASRPIPFSASIVGSSWNAADSSGEAPIRSPAATVTESCPLAAAAARRSFRWVARYAAPPAGMPLMLPLEPVAGSRLPWKSLMASSWIWVCVGLGFAGAAWVTVPPVAMASTATVPAASRPTTRRPPNRVLSRPVRAMSTPSSWRSPRMAVPRKAPRCRENYPARRDPAKDLSMN